MKGLFNCYTCGKFVLILYASDSSYGHVETVSVHLTTLFPGQAWLRLQLTTNLLESTDGRITVVIISWSISTNVWDWAWIEHASPGSAVGIATRTQYRNFIFWTLHAGVHHQYILHCFHDWSGPFNTHYFLFLIKRLIWLHKPVRTFL